MPPYPVSHRYHCHHLVCCQRLAGETLGPLFSFSVTLPWVHKVVDLQEVLPAETNLTPNDTQHLIQQVHLASLAGSMSVKQCLAITACEDPSIGKLSMTRTVS